MDVGEKITIYKDGKPVREVEILSQIIVNNSERITGTNVTGDNIISGPSFYLGESLFKELYGSSTLVNYSFDANPEDAQSVNEMLNRITQEYPDVGFETVEQRREEIGNYKMLVRIICLLIGGILGVIGLVNLINIIFTNLIIRNRELATLRSIGATKKQLRELIIRESIWYVLYAAMGGVLLSTVINVTVIREICDTMWVLTFRFTLYPAVVIVVLFLLIAITASVARNLFNGKKKYNRAP
jgi:putative ABC transport system permease protein